jgi:hypothetical protein
VRTAVAVLVGAVAMSSNLGGQIRLSDRVVPEGRGLTYEVPSLTPTGSVIETLLQVTQVPYGVEHLPPAPLAAPLDTGRAPDRIVRLEGLRLGDALEAVVAEDPRFEWTEMGGRILVRATGLGGMSALDAPVPAFDVRNAALADAIRALATAIDPGRPAPEVLQFGMALTAGGLVSSPSGGGERRFTVRVDGTTLLDALDALCRAHGQLSWAVQYDSGGTGLENAVISLVAPGTRVTTQSRRAKAESTASPDRLRIPVMRELQGMLSLYAQRARVRFGLERLPHRMETGFLDVPPLDLTDLPAAVAISRIVDVDSRYEWLDAGGIFHVRPVSARGPAPELLDRRLGPLHFVEITAEAALEALGEALGATLAGSGAGEGGLPGVDEREARRRQGEDRARRFSLILPGATLREALNAISLAHGALSWTAGQQPVVRGESRYTLTLSSYEGWSVSRTLVLPR